MRNTGFTVHWWFNYILKLHHPTWSFGNILYLYIIFSRRQLPSYSIQVDIHPLCDTHLLLQKLLHR